jgi:hypothetical protein
MGLKEYHIYKWSTTIMGENKKIYHIEKQNLLFDSIPGKLSFHQGTRKLHILSISCH